MKTGALVLAAGNASRFGGAKQLLEIDGESLLDRACHAARAAGCSPVLRVLGARADAILERPAPPDTVTLVHADWTSGMGGSLAAGVRRLLEIAPDCEAILVSLADQPLVSATVLRDLLEFAGGRASMVLSDYGAGGGPPAVFKRRHFPELTELAGDRGAKALAAARPDAVAWFSFPGGACDIDSPEAWEKFMIGRTDDERNAAC